MTDGQTTADFFIRGSVSRSGPELVLATKPFAVDSTARSWWYVLSTAGLLAAAVAGTLLAPHVLLKVASSVLTGLLLLRLFVIYHDQQHHAILPKSKAAEWFMWVFGILSLSPSSIWRASHNHHHNHNSKIKGSHIGSFPIMTREHFEKAPKSARWLYLFMRHPLTILFGYLTIFLHGMCLRPFVMKPREHWDCFISVLVHAGIAGCLIGFAGWQAWLLTQIIPHFIASAIGSYLFYAQHNFPGVAFYDKSGWTYDRAALESSSYMKMGPVMAWFSANIGYHHIHHLNARIPFYRLPEVLEALPEMRNPKVTTLKPFDMYRCLSLKVWDTKQQRMVALDGTDRE
ncbi:omega-6 fatty acid desaturase (delta-12 desaturase) [Prosthecobacter fusiformis]|uniref:Omega-6 fatty acid desaturase (Delta-12 desaturase) n=1 Tax=Prosthecobacter fusiformis TaxID=48464 RepID=A0A4R7RMX0_9BACT|nr:fatty acid desaturase [Prosthecobacter fusiformis]TDU66075.1 omega-6 fatty acid desaturase (delta-12 desaturase) [Prosthecobacter fusiformis]